MLLLKGDFALLRFNYFTACAISLVSLYFHALKKWKTKIVYPIIFIINKPVFDWSPSRKSFKIVVFNGCFYFFILLFMMIFGTFCYLVVFVYVIIEFVPLLCCPITIKSTASSMSLQLNNHTLRCLSYVGLTLITSPQQNKICPACE